MRATPGGRRAWVRPYAFDMSRATCQSWHWMSSPMPIVRYELNEQVYESLKERLLTREFGGGERLALQALADRLDVSRSPVAHALTRLVAEGLVVSERRGFTVRPLTAALMVGAHEARLALELHAA